MCSRKINLAYLFIILSAFGLPLEQLNSQPLSFYVDSVEYAWPTDATNQISSTFGETRSAHLHAGLDIRTWGQEGYKVFASRDGFIYRIATGPSGYGNVIYMKHEDDSFTVYAHLNRFEADLQAFSDSIRMKDYSFEIDRIIEEDSLYYKKGEIIAYTGSSGVGPPHLHFEIRNSDNAPINPLLTNLTIRDSLKPIFRRLGIEYLNPHTLKHEGYEIKNARKNGSSYHFGEISVDQPIGLAVNVHDRANYTPNVYAVYSLTMIHESDTLYHSSVDQFSYAEARHMFLDRSYQILAESGRGFQRLYKVNGNRLPIYKKLKNRGVLSFEEGQHNIQIIASDIFGNQSEATLILQVTGSNPIETISNVPAYPSPSSESKPFTVNLNELRFKKNAPLFASSESIIYGVSNDEGFVRFKTNRAIEKNLAPGKRQLFSTPDQRMWIEFPKNVLYDTLNLHLDIIRTGDQIQFNFSPDRLPVNGDIYFNYVLPDDLKSNKHLGLYSIDNRRNRFGFLGAKNIDGIIRSPLSEIGSLIIKQDNTPPWVGDPKLEQNLAGNYVIRVPAVDRDSGIDYKRSEITINDRNGIIEYDPDRDALYYYVPGYIPSSQNNVVINVFDGMGNSTSKTASFSY